MILPFYLSKPQRIGEILLKILFVVYQRRSAAQIELEREVYTMSPDNKWAKKLSLWTALIVMLLGLASCQAETAVTPEPTPADEQQEIAEAAPTDEPFTLPPPIVIVATHTPDPATATPTPTDTPEPTAVQPTATAVPPTNTPPPPLPTNPPAPVVPTATAVPPTAPPPPPPADPVGANGLVAANFELQDRSKFETNQPIWFEFTVANSTGGDVSYNALGVMPRKDGVDRPEWYQQTYGGRDSKISAGGFSWEDNIKLPETGSYTLRLVICFDGFDTCLQHRGTWHSLSQEIPITIN